MEGDACRIRDLVKTVHVWRQTKELKNSPSSDAGKLEHGKEDGKMRQRSDKIHGGATTIAGWSDAAYGDQLAAAERRLGYVIGLMSPTLSGSRHIIQWMSKFTRGLVKSSLGGEVYAFSEMVDHVSMHREVYAHFIGLSPGVAGLEVCDSLFARLKKEDYRRDVLDSANSGHPAGPGDAGVGKCLLAPCIGEPGRLIDENRERQGAPSPSCGIRGAIPGRITSAVRRCVMWKLDRLFWDFVCARSEYTY